MKIIDSFSGDYRFLSNFWLLDTPIRDANGIAYPSTEHYFVAHKTLDVDERRTIATIETAGKVKRYGRQLTLRPDWEEVKVNCMYEGLIQKFSQSEELNKALFNTSNALLIEGNHWHDQFWGNCVCEKHANQDGVNALGILLMRLRLDLGNS